MGVKGLPQSATGQTALFTGFNGPEIMQRHVTGYPTYTLLPYFREKSLLKVLNENGFNSTLLNSYSEVYLKRLRHRRRDRLLSASSQMQMASGREMFTLDDYRAGRSLYMDLTNWFLRSRGLDFEMKSAKKTGRQLVQLSRGYDLTVFEYFFTDKTGHEQSFGAAKRIIGHIEDFMSGIYEEFDSENETLVTGSDHGNIEDLSTGRHTENKVPAFIYGRYEDELAENLRSLYDIPRTIYEIAGIDVDFSQTIIPEDKSA